MAMSLFLQPMSEMRLLREHKHLFLSSLHEPISGENLLLREMILISDRTTGACACCIVSLQETALPR